MKTLFTYILSAAIAFSPLHLVQAQEEAPQSQKSAAEATMDRYWMSAADYEKEVGKVIYNLENIEEVVKDIDRANVSASESIGRHVATQIYKRLSAAVELMAVIHNDPNLAEETRAHAIRELIMSVGSLYFQIVRHRGADPLTVDEIEKRVDSLSRGKAFLREFVINDPMSWRPVWPEGQKLPSLLANERVNREDLGRAIHHKLKEYVTYALPEPTADSETTERMRIMLKDHIVGSALKIKQNRLSGQRGVAALYVGAALVVGIFPGLIGDVVGWMEGGRSDNSLAASGVIYFSIAASVALLKIKTIGKSVIRAMEDIIEILKDPKVEERRMGWRTWYDEVRLRGALKKVGEKLPEKGPGLGASLMNDIRWLPHDIRVRTMKIFNKVGLCKVKMSGAE